MTPEDNSLLSASHRRTALSRSGVRTLSRDRTPNSTDRLQDVGGRCLLLQRRLEIARAPALRRTAARSRSRSPPDRRRSAAAACSRCATNAPRRRAGDDDRAQAAVAPAQHRRDQQAAIRFAQTLDPFSDRAPADWARPSSIGDTGSVRRSRTMQARVARCQRPSGVTSLTDFLGHRVGPRQRRHLHHAVIADRT